MASEVRRIKVPTATWTSTLQIPALHCFRIHLSFCCWRSARDVSRARTRICGTKKRVRRCEWKSVEMKMPATELYTLRLCLHRCPPLKHKQLGHIKTFRRIAWGIVGTELSWEKLSPSTSLPFFNVWTLALITGDSKPKVIQRLLGNCVQYPSISHPKFSIWNARWQWTNKKNLTGQNVRCLSTKHRRFQVPTYL